MTHEPPTTEDRMMGSAARQEVHTRRSGFVIPSSYALRQASLQRGSALIVVFWMIAILGMVMFAGAKSLQADSQYTRMMRGRIFAKRYAEMGLEVARHPVMREDDPLLHFNADDGGGYNVKLVAEEARLNANHLIQTGDKVLLRRLFTSWGFKEQFVSALCDALKDWVDADTNVSLNGAEKRDYEKMGFDGMPFNRPFKEVEEMLLVRGMDIVNVERPDWREWFTVFGDGRVDINDARPELIALLADLLDEQLPRARYRRPQATYLAWIDLREYDLGDDPAEVMLEKGRVALSGGPAFGTGGWGHVRLNFGCPRERLREILRRMKAVVARAPGRAN